MTHSECIKHSVAKATIFQDNPDNAEEVWERYRLENNVDCYYHNCPLCTYLYQVRRSVTTDNITMFWCVCDVCPISDQKSHELCHLFMTTDNGRELDKPERDQLFTRIRTAVRTWTKKQLYEDIERLEKE